MKYAHAFCVGTLVLVAACGPPVEPSNPAEAAVATPASARSTQLGAQAEPARVLGRSGGVASNSRAAITEDESPTAPIAGAMNAAGRGETPSSTEPDASATSITAGEPHQGVSDVECEILSKFTGPGLAQVKAHVKPDCVTEPRSKLVVRRGDKALSTLTIEESVPLAGAKYDSALFELPPRGAKLNLHFKAKCMGRSELTHGIGRCKMP